MSDFSRKDFIAVLGTVGATAALQAADATTAEAEEVAAAPSAHAHSAPAHSRPMTSMASSKPLGSEPEAYTFFTQPEWQFVEAAVERLIPTDAAGPGAREAGVAFYIDQQLAGAYGLAAKMYKNAPWVPDAPAEFGYQLSQTPQEVYRLGIAATNDYCQKTYGKTFDALTSAASQDEVLTLLQTGKLAFDTVPAATFFQILYANTVEGFFSDPLYGGNRDMVGWKLVGFPGAAAAYYAYIEKHNVAYKVTPIGIAGLQQQEQAMVETRAAAMGDEMTMHEIIAQKALGIK